MKKSLPFYLLCAALLLVSAIGNTALSDRISFSGRIVDLDKPVTRVVTETDAAGAPQYVVESTVTGERLATFGDYASAKTFAEEVNPEVAYREPTAGP